MVMNQSPIEDNRFPADPSKLRWQLGMLTTEAFRAAVMHRTLPEREGILESIIHLHEVSDGSGWIAEQPRRAVRDVRLADLVGQLNQVGLGLAYEDTSVRRMLDADPGEWKNDHGRNGHRAAGVRMVLQIFFASPEEYVDDTGKFLRDLDAKSLEFRRGRLGGFVFDRFRTVGDGGHRKPGSRLRRWKNELKPPTGQG